MYFAECFVFRNNRLFLHRCEPTDRINISFGVADCCCAIGNFMRLTSPQGPPPPLPLSSCPPTPWGTVAK